MVPDTRVGSTFGHEFIGEVVEVGSEVSRIKIGDKVLVPFNISCGQCAFCKQELYGNCHESNSMATASGGIYNYEEMKDPVLFIKRITGWYGADVCIDAVGADTSGSALYTITGKKLHTIVCHYL